MTADRTRKESTKAAPKKAPKKAPAKKAPAKKAPAKKAGDQAGGEQKRARRRASAPRAESRPARSAAEVAERVVEQLGRLTGKPAEGVTGLERTDDGWRVTVEVVEVRRVPETTDVLARYVVDADAHGDLASYQRASRYTRGSAREE